MKKNLLDVIFASDKRKNVLLFLQDGPREMSSLLAFLKTTRQALLPQVRILESHNLLCRNTGDVYELTTIGKLLVSEMSSLLALVDALDENIDYWGTHDLGFIPPHLLERIKELRSSTVVEPDLTLLYEVDRNFMKKTRESKSVAVFTSFLFPDYVSHISEWIDCGLDISLIITKELFEKVKAENYDYLRLFVSEGYGKLFVYNEKVRVISFSLNDYCIMFRLFTKGGDFDNKLLMVRDPKAIGWGGDLFEHYKQKSMPITGI